MFGLVVDYKCVTWKINRANTPLKREKKTFHYLKALKQYIICLQETDIRKKDIKYLGKNLSHHVSEKKERNGVVLVYKSSTKTRACID